jgi:hypothetical protein
MEDEKWIPKSFKVGSEWPYPNAAVKNHCGKYIFKGY